MKKQKVYRDTLIKLFRSIYNFGCVIGENNLDKENGWKTIKRIIEEAKYGE